MISARMTTTAFLVISVIFLFGCGRNAERKIKLSDASSISANVTQTASTVLKVSPEQQQQIAILNFRNDTHDASLNWLRRGLADMFATELAQSPYLNIVPIKRIYEITQEHGKTEADLQDPATAAMIAQQANAEIILSGRIYPLGDSLCISVEMINAQTGRQIRKETVHGYGMEQIFSMVGDLSERVRTNIRGDFKEINYAGIELKEMTESIEAFRYFSQARENQEKLLYNEAEKYLKQAVEADSTFAAAYLELAYLEHNFGKNDEASLALEKCKQYANKLSDSDAIKLDLLVNIMKGEYQDLVPILEEGIERLPTDAELRIQLARFYRNMGIYDRSLQEFETALELDPNRKMLYNDLGYLHANRGDFTSAIRNIDIYRDLAPDEPNPYDSKGEILMMAGRLNEAAEQFKTALNKWPEFYYSALHLAELYSEAGDKENSLKYLNQAIASAPNDKWGDNINLVRARILWKFGEVKKAQALLDDLIKKSPYSIKPVVIAAELHKSVGKESDAQGIYLSAFKRFKKYFDEGKGDFGDVDNFVGLTLTADLPPGDVIPVLEKIIANYELSGFYQFITREITALMYLRNGEPDKAAGCNNEIATQDFNFLFTMHNNGWSLWRHFFEALRYAQDIEANDYWLAKRILGASREMGRKDLEVLARLFRASIHQTRHNLEGIADEYQDIGMPQESDWFVIGPFDAKNISGFEHPFPPENEIKLDASYDDSGQEIKWQPANDQYSDGYMNFKSVFDHDHWTVGYGLIYAFSPEERKVQIRVGSDETFKLWLNDELISQRYIRENAVIDRDIVAVILHPGYNKLLIKVTNTDLEWGYYFRITDESGNAFYDITYHSPKELEKKFALR